MDQINKLQKEVEDIRRILQLKQEELSRIKNEVNKQNGIHNTEQTVISPEQLSTRDQDPPVLWTPKSNQLETSYKESIDSSIYTETLEHYQCNSNNMAVHNTGSFNGDPDQANKGFKIAETRVNAFIGETLPRWAIERYSRQILLSEIGVSGQQKLCAAKVLIVGAGGLGCPAGAYLAGAGVGEIGIVDYDTVDLTNIHRQFLHGERDQFISKAESAANSLRSLNSRIKVTPHNVQLTSQNAVQIASQYDLVLDCTDNVPTRYLLNDLCVLTKLPLISGSALKMEGQLTVYGYREKDHSEKDAYKGPCYRCVFPSPPPAAAVGSCSSQGVAPPVPGTIGSLQALEAIKYIVGQPRTKLLVGRMLLFDGDDITFRTVKLRPRSQDCAVCSDAPTISQLIDYELFCQAQAKEKIKQEARLKSEVRKREKDKRMSGQSYYGFRTAEGTHKWVQDVPKSERKLGPPCKDVCTKGTLKKCSDFDENARNEIFIKFWNDLDWKGKKGYVKSLVDSVPVKRRRVKLKGVVSRKGGSKLYHLLLGGDRLPVCRVMFLNTLGVKEAMVRCWLVNEERPKLTKKPLKAINVDSYIDSLPKLPPKCQYCLNSGSKIQYIHLENIKNLFQLYNLYSQDMKLKNSAPASRKTFSKVDLDLQILPAEQRISPTELASLLSADCEHRHLLVDVRSEAEFNMCRIDGSTNYPIELLYGERLELLLEEIRKALNSVTFVCRRGNDSQSAMRTVLEAIESEHRAKLKDLCGGLHAWSHTVDQQFPIY